MTWNVQRKARDRHDPVVSRFVSGLALQGLLACCLPHPGWSQQSASSLAYETLKIEVAKRNESERFFYVSQETSTRTGGHVWTERVVQIRSGVLRRLIAIDGKPVTAEQARAEDQRIEKLVAHPDKIWKAEDDHEDGKDIAKIMSHAFLFTYDGKTGDCTRVRFVPNPSFKPSGYEERILHTLEGIVLIKEPEDRVCEVNGTISHSVEIGYGVLGRLEQGGQVHLVRLKTASGVWRITSLNIHFVGKILVMKDMSQNSDEVRSNFRELSADPTLSQAAELTKHQSE